MIRTIISIILLVVIALGFGVIGCEVLQLSGIKAQNYKADFDIKRSKLFVYSIYENEFKDVTKVQHRTENTEERSFVSTVYMINNSSKISLFEKLSSDNDKLKREIYNDLSFFIKDSKRSEYNRTFYKIDKFGWVGIGLFIIAMIWSINLPKIKQRLIDEGKKQRLIDEKNKIYKQRRERTEKSKQLQVERIGESDKENKDS